MKSWVKWFVENPIAANFLMFLILACGFVGWFKMRKEIFPETSLNLVSIRVPYPNATPEEVEKGICIPIEEAIEGVDGIKSVRSYANESSGSVTVEISPSRSVREVMSDLKARIDAIDNFAQEAEEPVIEELLIKSQVLSVAVIADTDESTLRRLAEKVRDDLLLHKLPKEAPGRFDAPPANGWSRIQWEISSALRQVVRFFNNALNEPARISQVSIAGVREYEISLEVSEAELRRHALTLESVAQAVRQSSIDLPAGSLRTTAGEILIRTQARRYTASEFESITVATRPDGSVIKLGQIATVRDGFVDNDLFTRFDGKPAVMVNVYRTGEEDTLRLVELVRHYVQTADQRFAPGVELKIWNDQSILLEGRMNLLFSNGLQGFILIVIVLGLFLEPRLAFYVSLGIPISIAGGLLAMPQFDISINMISLFAFILVLGVVVDDAIVIGENVHHRMTALREPPKVAAARGTLEVAVVVMFGVAVTIVAFTPMLAVSGVGGKIWRNIPLVVIPVLMISTIESKLILPSHLAQLRVRPASEKKGLLTRFQLIVEKALDKFAFTIYQPVLQWCLHRRIIVACAFLSIFILVIGVIQSGFIPFRFFPVIEGDIISAKLTLPEGVPVQTTDEAIRRIEKAAQTIAQKYKTKDGHSIVRHMHATVGGQPFLTSFWSFSGGGSVNKGEVTLELCPAAERNVKAADIKSQWRDLTGPIAGATELVYRTNSDRGGAAIDLLLTGARIDELTLASEKVKAKLATYEGVTDITSSDREGKREIKLGILPQAEALGLRLADLTRQVRQSFYGEEVHRLQRGRDEVKVMVRYPKDERQSLQNLSDMRVRLRDGSEVPFTEVATAGYGRSYAQIQRHDRQRSIIISADVDPANPKANANKILEDMQATFLPQLLRELPGVRWNFEGEQKNQREDIQQMLIGWLFALVGIFVLLAIPLRSYLQPLIVMSVIPFGLVGAVLGHIALQMELSIMSMCGCVALAGMVVNESLIMVDSINRHRRRGEELFEATWKAAIHRFRPIMATSITTFVGLIPIMSETDIQALFLVPMSVALGFGGLFATFITLLLVPSLYQILEDIRHTLGLKPQNQPEAPQEEPQDVAIV